MVRIACEGEVRELDVPKYQPATLLINDPIFRGTDDSAFSDLSRFLGIPLAARRIPVDPYWDMDLTNFEVSSLFRNCDLSTRSSVSSNDAKNLLPFGGIPVEWALDPGPVYVARLDYKPLHPLHAAAIVAFCSRYIRLAFQDCIDAERNIGSPRRAMFEEEVPSAVSPRASFSEPTTNRERVYERRRAVLGLATSGTFAEFFEQYKDRRIQGRPDLWDVDEDELDHMQRMELLNYPPDELEPRLEWEHVSSPFDV